MIGLRAVSMSGDDVVPPLRLSRGLWVCGVVVVVAFALAVPFGPLGAQPRGGDNDFAEEDGDSLYPWLDQDDEEEERLPLTNMRIVVSNELGDEDEEPIEYYGRVVRIELEREDDIFLPGGGIERIIFEGDPDFEARTYRFDQLYELLGEPPESLGTVPPHAVLHVRDPNVQSGFARVTYDRIDLIEYPRTWLDIFRDVMEAAEGVDEMLLALAEFRWRYADEIEEGFSPRMRLAFEDAVIDQYLLMRNLEPENAQVVLDFGDYLDELGRYDEELELYVMTRNRGLADPDGEMAYRLGRLYLRVLQVPETAVVEFEAVPFPPETRVGIEAALLRMEALLASGRYYEARSLDGRLFRAINAYEEAWSALDEAERDELLDEQSWEELQDEITHWRLRLHLLVGKSYLRRGELYYAARRLSFFNPSGPVDAVIRNSPDYPEAQVLLATCLLNMERFEGNGSTSGRSSVVPSVNFRQVAVLNEAMREAERIRDADVRSVLRNPGYQVVGPDQPEAEFDPFRARALCLLARAELQRSMRDAIDSQLDDRQRRSRGNEPLEPLLARRIIPDPPENAVKYALQAWRHDPTSAEPLLIFAEAAMRPDPSRGPSYANELRNHAFAWLERADQVDPTNPVRHYQEGFYHARERNFAAAIPALRRAIRMEPSFIDAYVLLGELYYRLALTAARTGEGGDPLSLLRRAIDYFSTALSIDPWRISVKIKLGHCYLERAKSNFDRAQREVGLYRLGQIDRDTVQLTWHSVSTDLQLATEQFDIDGMIEPRVLELIDNPRGAPWIVIDVGEQAGVQRDLTMRATTSAGTTFGVRIFEVSTTIALAEPVGYEVDPAVPRAVQQLRVGDRLSRPQMPARRETEEATPQVIYPEETLIARSAMGYVYYMRDYIRDFIDERADDETTDPYGREYEPGPELDRAEELFRWVIEWVDQSRGTQDYTMHPAYLYALEAYDRLQQRRARVQWVDTFERDRRGNRVDILGEGWRVNLERDPSLTYDTSARESRLRIFIDEARRAEGKWTYVMREEANLDRFHAIQADMIVDPQSGIPNSVHGEFGLAFEMRDTRGNPDDPVQMRLVVTVDREGTWRMHYRDDEERFTRVIELDEIGPYSPSPILQVRLIREPAERGTEGRFRLELGDSHAATLPTPQQRRGRRSPELYVGLAILPQADTTRFNAEVTAVRIIRERSEDD